MRLKALILSALFMLGSTVQVSAGVSSGWLDYFVGKVGKPGSAAFEVMTENGLILSRLKRDYAAFSFGEERLSEEERVSEPVDVSEFYFVVEYEVCGSAENFFNDKIYKLTYRYHTTDTNTLVDEILDINAFFNKVRGNTQPEVIESTENKLTTSYLLGIGSINNVVFKNTLSKNVQYIDVSVTADSVCNSSN